MTQPQEQKPDLGLLTSAFTSETPPSPMPFSGDPVSAVQGSFDFVEFKIQMLKGVLQEDSPLINRHRINIECVLAYYQNGGKLPARGTIRWMVDGKMSETEPTFPTTAAVWTDSVCATLSHR